MKYLLCFILLFITVINSYSQVIGATDIISSSLILGNEYNIRVENVSDITTVNNYLDIKVGMYLWTSTSIPNQDCNEFLITEVTDIGNGILDLKGTNLRRSGFSGVARGRGSALVEYTPSYELPYFLPTSSANFGMINPKVQTCIMNDLIFKIDNSIKAGDSDLDSILSIQFIQDTILEVTLRSGFKLRDTFSTSTTTINSTILFDDNMFNGTGGINNEITIDTFLIATKNDIKNWYLYEYSIGNGMNLNENQISVPDLPSDNSFIRVIRNIAEYPIGNLVIKTGNILTFNDYNFEENEKITIYIYR